MLNFICIERRGLYLSQIYRFSLPFYFPLYIHIHTYKHTFNPNETHIDVIMDPPIFPVMPCIFMVVVSQPIMR